MQWINSLTEWKIKNFNTLNRVIDDYEVYQAIPTGDVKSLLSLAYDVYCLEAKNNLSEDIVKRLRNRRTYQGARYEIAVGAVLLRSGFKLEQSQEPNSLGRRCEFHAIHEKSGILFGVEAKSRHRQGVLHEKGKQSKILKAGKKTYFFDIKETKDGKPYLMITESWFKTDKEDEEPERKSIIVFPEQAQDFAFTTTVMLAKIVKD